MANLEEIIKHELFFIQTFYDCEYIRYDHIFEEMHCDELGFLIKEAIKNMRNITKNIFWIIMNMTMNNILEIVIYLKIF